MSRINGYALLFLGVAAAALLISVSAAQSFLHAWHLGISQSYVHAVVLSGGSLGAALMQPLAFLAASNSFRSWNIGRGVVAATLGILCLIYAASCSLGFVSGARTDLTAQRDRDHANYELTKARAEAASVELKQLAAAPPASRKLEKERADRRGQLERIVAEAQRGLQAAGAPGAADAQSEAIAAYAAAAGLAWAPADVARWLLLITVVFFEVGSAASLIVVQALAPIAPTAVPATVAAQPTSIEPLAPKLDAAKPGRKRRTDLDALLERLKAAPGGRIEGSISSLKSRLGGSSKTATFRAIRELEGAGAITREATANGTAIAIA